jgi:hypothetical protein
LNGARRRSAVEAGRWAGVEVRAIKGTAGVTEEGAIRAVEEVMEAATQAVATERDTKPNGPMAMVTEAEMSIMTPITREEVAMDVEVAEAIRDEVVGCDGKVGEREEGGRETTRHEDV